MVPAGISPNHVSLQGGRDSFAGTVLWVLGTNEPRRPGTRHGFCEAAAHGPGTRPRTPQSVWGLQTEVKCGLARIGRNSCSTRSYEKNRRAT
jgi:hypothetical protein